MRHRRRSVAGRRGGGGVVDRSRRASSPRPLLLAFFAGRPGRPCGPRGRGRAIGPGRPVGEARGVTGQPGPAHRRVPTVPPRGVHRGPGGVRSPRPVGGPAVFADRGGMHSVGLGVCGAGGGAGLSCHPVAVLFLRSCGLSSGRTGRLAEREPVLEAQGPPQSRPGIRASLHPRSLRCSSVAYLWVGALVTPCARGAGTLSVRTPYSGVVPWGRRDVGQGPCGHPGRADGHAEQPACHQPDESEQQPGHLLRSRGSWVCPGVVMARA
jgi:hypothetical protein